MLCIQETITQSIGRFDPYITIQHKTIILLHFLVIFLITNLQISITDNNFGQDRVIELKTTLVPKQTVRVETDIISGLSKWTSGQYRARVVSAVVMD